MRKHEKLLPKIQPSITLISYDWLTGNYVDATLIGIRRQLDEHPDCISLIKLLRDLQINSTLLTREKHLALYLEDMQALGHNTFDLLAGKALDVFPKKILEIDLQQLAKIKALHNEFIDRRIAHYEKVPKVKSLGTFQDLDNAVRFLKAYFKSISCYLLLTVLNFYQFLNTTGSRSLNSLGSLKLARKWVKMNNVN